MRIIIPCDTASGADTVCKFIRRHCSTLNSIVTLDTSGHSPTSFYVTVEPKAYDVGKQSTWGNNER